MVAARTRSGPRTFGWWGPHTDSVHNDVFGVLGVGTGLGTPKTLRAILQFWKTSCPPFGAHGDVPIDVLSKGVELRRQRGPACTAPPHTYAAVKRMNQVGAAS